MSTHNDSRTYAPQDICPPINKSINGHLPPVENATWTFGPPELIFGADVLILQMDVWPPLLISERDICPTDKLRRKKNLFIGLLLSEEQNVKQLITPSI